MSSESSPTSSTPHSPTLSSSQTSFASDTSTKSVYWVTSLTSLSKLATALDPDAGDFVLFLSRAVDGEDEGKAPSVGEAIKDIGRHVLQDEDAFVGNWKTEGGGHYVLDKTIAPDGEGKPLSEILTSSKTNPLTPVQTPNLLPALSLHSILSIPLPSSTHTLHLLEKTSVSFPPVHATSEENTATPPEDAKNPFGLPTTQDWRSLWSAWDAVTLHMIPPSMRHQKPIELRHICLFYVGHIPTFLDMLLSKTLGEPHTEPEYFTRLFERGIDPHVDDPDHCHNHSEVPTKSEDWPSFADILAYRDRVRARVLGIYDDVKEGRRVWSRRLVRTVVLTYEHEGWHVETLLYMLIQRAGTGTLPPPGTPPPWSALSTQWNSIPLPTTPTTTIGPATITLGHDDQEPDDLLFFNEVEAHEFGWDNESPRREVQVGRVNVEWGPVTNGEFRKFLEGEGGMEVKMPANWVVVDGEIKVRTLYGPVPFEIAERWPVLTAYDDLAAYARSKGGRIPTEPELRLFLDTYEVGHEGGANVGFRNWHPCPATTGCVQDGGRGSNGGVWEWTSTHFDGHEGLAPTKLFPGYSTDFFDTKHHVVLGASYATIPRLASRRTARNFYQHNYPYPWVSARVVYDA